MSDTKNFSLYQRQKVTKPLIEDTIPEYLDGDRKNAALDFAAYMRANRMKPAWSLTNKWKAVYRGKAICNICISTCDEKGYHRGYYARPGAAASWYINPYLTHMEAYKDIIMSEGLQDLVWNSAFRCVYSGESPSPGVGCSPDKPCAPGGVITVLGKEIEHNCCNHLSLLMWNPDEAALRGIETLLELEKRAREGT